MTEPAIGEKTSIELKLLIPILGGVFGFAAWMTTVHFDVAQLKTDVVEIKHQGERILKHLKPADVAARRADLDGNDF